MPEVQNQTEIDPRKLIIKAREDSFRASKKLKKGMPVQALLSDKLVVTETTSDPWMLGSGIWMIKIHGVTGAVDCATVTPLPLP